MGLITGNLRTRPQGRVFACHGFTMVELIVVIIVLGIIALVAGSRFFSTSKFTEMGFADTAANSFRYAHKIALSSGCDTRAWITATSVSLFQRANNCNSGAFTTPLQRPGGTVWAENVPSGVSVSSLDIYFDANGSPHAHPSGSKLTAATGFTVGTRTVTVEAETGFVHQ